MKCIGYATLEKFVERVDPFHALYLTLTEETLPGADGLDLFRCELLLQVNVWDGAGDILLYWRLVVGEAIAPGGAPWPEHAFNLRVAGKSALTAVKEFLATQPNVKRLEEGALIAMPRGLKLLKGYADCLEFDNASGTFHLKRPVGTDTGQA